MPALRGMVTAAKKELSMAVGNIMFGLLLFAVVTIVVAMLLSKKKPTASAEEDDAADEVALSGAGPTLGGESMLAADIAKEHRHDEGQCCRHCGEDHSKQQEKPRGAR